MKKLIGKWRLIRGFCPECNSSPPAKNCLVCRGPSQYSYGHNLNRHVAALWWIRFLKLHNFHKKAES